MDAKNNNKKHYSHIFKYSQNPGSIPGWPSKKEVKNETL
jgi:hypothetical protein